MQSDGWETSTYVVCVVNASHLFPHHCRPRNHGERKDLDEIFDIVIFASQAGKISAKLILVPGELTPILAETDGKDNLLAAYSALLCMLAEALARHCTQLLEPIAVRSFLSLGAVAKDELELGEAAVYSLRWRGKQDRMQKILYGRGRSRSFGR